MSSHPRPILRTNASARLISTAVWALIVVACAPAAPSRSRRSAPQLASTHEAACDSAYGALCGPSGEADGERLSRHKEILRSVEQASLDVIAERLHFDPATFDALDAALAVRSEDERRAIQRLFREVRAAEVQRRVAPLRATVIAEHERLRRIAIARVLASDAPDREDALARLERSEIAWVDASAEGAEVRRGLRRGCGSDLLVDDAWIDKQYTAITLCPGFLLVSVVDGEPAEGGPAFRQRIAFLLAHELGHVVFGRTTSYDEELDAELRADELATEVLATDLAAIEGRTAREIHLRRAIEPLCYPERNAVHGSGPDRVDGVVARHPTIVATLGCAPRDAWATRLATEARDVID